MNEFLPSADDVRRLLAEVSEMHMPYGKYGRKVFPPKGFPIMDLPIEYLVWFQMQGFPKGRLGELMAEVLAIKEQGMDSLFDPFRRQRGGRTKTKQDRPKRFDF